MILLKKAQKKKLTKIEPVALKSSKIEKPKVKVAKKIKIKRKESPMDDLTPKGDHVKSVQQSMKQEELQEEIIHTQQNFFIEKLATTEDEPEQRFHDDGEISPQYKKETGVLFGAAYENKYIDIIENDDIVDDTEINLRMLEISLGMTKEELQELTKIEIKVDTTNTHMQYVGEVLQKLEILRLNDSVIPSVRDMGTSFRYIQVLSLNR